MNDLNKLNTDARKRKDANKPPPVNKCMYMGCPMRASIKDLDGYKCAFHKNGDYHYEITESIKKNIKHVHAYVKMINWSSIDWKTWSDYLSTTVYCPKEDEELNSLYLNRYYLWLSEKIKIEATDFIANKEMYQTVGMLPENKK